MNSREERRAEILRACEVIVDGIVQGDVPSTDDVLLDDYYPNVGVGPETFWKAVARLERDGILWQVPDGRVRLAAVSRSSAGRALMLREEAETAAIRAIGGAERPISVDTELPERDTEPLLFFKLDLQYHCSLMGAVGMSTGELGVRSWGNVVRVFLSGLRIMEDDLRAIAAWNEELRLAMTYKRDIERMLAALQNYFKAMQSLFDGRSAPQGRRLVRV